MVFRVQLCTIASDKKISIAKNASQHSVHTVLASLVAASGPTLGRTPRTGWWEPRRACARMGDGHSGLLPRLIAVFSPVPAARCSAGRQFSGLQAGSVKTALSRPVHRRVPKTLTYTQPKIISALWVLPT